MYIAYVLYGKKKNFRMGIQEIPCMNADMTSSQYVIIMPLLIEIEKNEYSGILTFLNVQKGNLHHKRNENLKNLIKKKHFAYSFIYVIE